jgi:hypothetical protein
VRYIEKFEDFHGRREHFIVALAAHNDANQDWPSTGLHVDRAL